MAFKIKLTPTAGRDLQNAVDWEENRNPGLGKKCFNDIEQRLFDIIEIPAIGSVRYDDIRCVTTKTFRYLIHYRVDLRNETITILLIWNTKQKPLW